MAIHGGFKFFNRNQALAVDGSTVVASSGDETSDLALDRNPNTFWRSVSSNDLTTETITITLPAPVTADRIMLLDHNWKQYTVKYDVTGTPTQFTSVVGLDGSLVGGITETTFADGSSYYEHAAVTYSILYITVTKTQVVDAQKYICQIVVTDELGTIQGFPIVEDMSISRTERVNKTISGKVISQKSAKVFRCSLNFTTYPVNSVYSPDLDLMLELFERDDNFIIWPCGGRRGTNYFRYTIPGFRLKDAFEVQTVGDFSPAYLSSVYINPVDLVMSFEEAV